MNRKVYIFGDLHFPRGGASANYVGLLARALSGQQYKVIIISTSNDNASEDDYKELEDLSIELIEIKPSRIRLLRHIDLNYRLGKIIVKKLYKSDISPQDILISYTTNPYTLKSVLRFARKRKLIISGCITERLSREMFSDDIRGAFEYKKYLAATEKILPKFDIVFPISRYLRNYYKKMGANTFILPILADIDGITDNYGNRYGKLKYIFPASGQMKDEFKNILEGFCKAQDAIGSNFELHITGFTESKVIDFYPEVRKKIGSTVFCHGWMDYGDLKKLYDQMDYLIIARKENQMTLANFPSKVPEVMCHGVIPVVSRVGDYTALLLEDLKNSFVFDGYDTRACTEIIKKTAQYDRSQLQLISKNAIETVRNKLDPSIWGAKLSEVFDSLR